MKKVRFFMIALVLLVISGCAGDGQYKGGSGSGYGMGEYTGRLNGCKRTK